MILIDNSTVISELIPELFYYVDPDTPIVTELSIEVRAFIKALIIEAFFPTSASETLYNPEWVYRLRADRILKSLFSTEWVDLDIVDIEGNYILIIEE